jgi:hypothetical protein
MVTVLAVGAPTVIIARRRPIKQGRTPPPVGHHRRLGGSLPCVDAYLSFLLCHDAGLYFLISVGLRLLHMWWSSSCRGSSLPRRGSWIAGKVPSLHGRMDWRPLSVPLERCSWNMTLVASDPRLSNKTSSPRRVFLAPYPNSSSPSTGCWRNSRSSFSYRRQTWRCER